MKQTPLRPNIQNTDNKSDVKKKLSLVKTTHGIASNLAEGSLEKAFAKTMVAGIKLAEDNPFNDPGVCPLRLYDFLRTFGINVLAWQPETLFAAIDKRFHGWSEDKATLALEHFHETGLLQTDVPIQIRQKIYAIRIVVTSDTAHTEWHVFEKVGSAFNDRVAQFGIVERLSTGECARTVALIDAIRPDEFSKEIKVYIAASAHEDGLITIWPSKYLKMAGSYLNQMNADSTEVQNRDRLCKEIDRKLEILKAEGSKIHKVEDDVASVQALKIFAVDRMGDEAV